MAERHFSIAELHGRYDSAVSAFARTIADPTLRVQFRQGVDGFMRACAAGVWSVGEGVSPRFLEALNSIYIKGNPIPSYLYWEMVSMMGSYPGFAVPPFFTKMLAADRLYGTETAKRFTELFELLLQLFAAVDDKVTEREAAFITDCCDTLRRLYAGDAPKRAAAPGNPSAPETEPEKTEDAAPEPDLDTLLAELDELCGLETIKRDVKSLVNLVRVRRLREECGLAVPPLSLHLVFMGNPGTGKTTVARLLAQIYRAIGVLSKGQLVEVDRSGLVAGYVGQTALKTSEVIKSALGGVLFIDEAYALANQENANDFGREAIEVLLKGMEDNRKDLVVIVAGYTALMGKFISSNPGLESRFNKYFYFEDYTGGELATIFASMCTKNEYVPDAEAEAYAKDLFLRLYEERDENFGNARDVRNIFEKAVARQSDRVAAMEKPTKEDLMALTVADLKEEEPKE